jgi:hypothetical protein
MENAALHLADVVLDVADETGVLIVCGREQRGRRAGGGAAPGQRGGGSAHRALGPAERYKGDAAINLAIAQKMEY